MSFVDVSNQNTVKVTVCFLWVLFPDGAVFVPIVLHWSIYWTTCP